MATTNNTTDNTPDSLSGDSADDDTTDGPLVDPTQTTRDLAIQMLMLMEEHFPDVIVYRYPLDMSSPKSVDDIRSELGPAAIMPTDPDGYYAFLYIIDTAGNWIPVFLPIDEVRTAMFALAVREDPTWAQEIAFFPWLLP